MFSDQKLKYILENLANCPKTAATLPCSIENFKKVMPMIDDKVLEKLYDALVLESKLQKYGS